MAFVGKDNRLMVLHLLPESGCDIITDTHLRPPWSFRTRTKRTASDLGSRPASRTSPIESAHPFRLSCRNNPGRTPPPNLEGRRQLAVQGLLAVLLARLFHGVQLCGGSHRKPLRSNSTSGAASPPKSATSAIRFLRWGTPQNCAACTRQATDHRPISS